MGNTNQFIFSIIYPNETNANSIDTLSISTDGKYIDKELVKSRLTLPNGDIEIITEEFGEDGNDKQPATFKHTYTLGSTTYKKRKDVQFTGEKAWINRHEYSYKKKPGRKYYQNKLAVQQLKATFYSLSSSVHAHLTQRLRQNSLFYVVLFLKCNFHHKVIYHYFEEHMNIAVRNLYSIQ